MNRRDLLRGVIAGLLGGGAAVPLLEGPAFADGGRVLNDEPANIATGCVLNRRAVEQMGGRSWAEVAKEMQSRVMFEAELEGGFVLRGGSVSQLAQKFTRTIRPASSPHWSRS